MACMVRCSGLTGPHGELARDHEVDARKPHGVLVRGHMLGFSGRQHDSYWCPSVGQSRVKCLYIQWSVSPLMMNFIAPTVQTHLLRFRR